MRPRRYTYAYKTSDGRRHEASIEADSREAVFVALRRQGIRPIKVVAEDGSKANGEREEGERKREKVWRGVRLAYLASLVLLAPLVLALFFFQENPGKWSSLFSGVFWANPPASSSPRHQIYGDPALMEELYERGFAGVFDDPAGRYMAYFAQPGILPDERLLAKLRPAVLAGDGSKAPPAAVESPLEPSREILELKAIVAGMRQEMQDFLADGTSMVTYLNALSERQQEELGIYERIAAELEGEKDESVREQKNAALRALGLKTVPRPKSARR